MKNLLTTLLILFLIGCAPETKNNEKELLKDDLLSIEKVPLTEPDLVERVIESIPSPLEMTSLIQGVGANYSKTILNRPENVKKYDTNFKKAINLGIYGADLGYINLYEQNQDALLYLNSVKKLADDIRVGQYFNFGSLKRLTNVSGNMDSLLYITISNFEDMYRTLYEQKRSSLTTLMLTGGWLEALHIASQINRQNKEKEWHKELSEKIGEQKITLDQIMILLSVYKKDHSIQKLRSDLGRLEKIFNQVDVKYIYEEPTFTVIDDMIMVQDHSKSIVNISDQILVDITSETEAIRTELTK